tara:strand:+ start:66 stop:1016 length:951 start_codon:yes stop_codon:yes gene_type:complete
MKIAFYSPHLCLRGTTVALYDYAIYNKSLLGNESLVIYEENHQHNDDTTIAKFNETLECVPIASIEHLDKALSDHKCDAVYIIKCGHKNDGRMASACKTLIHAIGVVNESEAHGDVYAYGSYWLSKVCSDGRLPAVPYMVDLPDVDGDLREDLKIPEDALVFGRNGGPDTWNLRWASSVVESVAKASPNTFFVFQNTPKFCDLKNVIHIESTADMSYKTKFINTCDAMIHCRNEGESFGLSCGEFSIRNKPVITWHGSPERNHIEVLGDRGLYYSGPEDMRDILTSFVPEPQKDWNAYTDYTPEKVMRIFEEVYLS